MATEQPKAFYRVSCPCGAALKIDPMQTARRLRCPKCSLVLAFIVSINPKTRKSQVSIVVSPDAVKTEGESLGILAARQDEGEPGREMDVEMEVEEEAPAPPPPSRTRGKSIKGVLGTCVCGTSFPVDEEELTSIQACPKCGIEYHCVIKMERGTKKRSAILVPVKTLPARRGTIAPGQLPAAPPKTVKRTHVFTKQRTRPPAAKARPEIPPGAQAVDCPCGEPLVVRKKDVAKGMSCPGCGRELRFQEVPDPQTLHPVIRIRPEKK